ncbi:MAG: hypothetical protein AAF557_18440 [Pseudomonadota bacterium]
MRTLQKAQRIVNQAPKEAMGDAIGLAAVAILIFTGFMAPAFV